MPIEVLFSPGDDTSAKGATTSRDRRTLGHMPYLDLRPDNVREVQVLVDGNWVPGDLEAHRRDASGAWNGWVRWRRIAGQSHVDWFTEEQVRPTSRYIRRRTTWRDGTKQPYGPRGRGVVQRAGGQLLLSPLSKKLRLPALARPRLIM